MPADTSSTLKTLERFEREAFLVSKRVSVRANKASSIYLHDTSDDFKKIEAAKNAIIEDAREKQQDGTLRWAPLRRDVSFLVHAIEENSSNRKQRENLYIQQIESSYDKMISRGHKIVDRVRAIDDFGDDKIIARKNQLIEFFEKEILDLKNSETSGFLMSVEREKKLEDSAVCYLKRLERSASRREILDVLNDIIDFLCDIAEFIRENAPTFPRWQNG